MSKFSNDLADRFDGSTAFETLEFLCGDRLGHGMSREVFRYALDDRFVIKFELTEGAFQNVLEARTWEEVEYTRHAKWFAPVKAISGCGRVLLMQYADPISLAQLPVQVPAFFTDLKPENWGRIGRQPVAVDYGRSLLMSRGLGGNALRKATWLS